MISSILVLGAGGMLGSTLMRTLPHLVQQPVWGTLRGMPVATQYQENIIGHVDAANLASINAALDKTQPGVLINCIGIIKQLDQGKQALPCIEINALLPHQLHAICQVRGIRLIHLSTDCVFSGNKGNYVESDLADPPDLYGQSKLLGEVTGHGALTLRTSIIGHELGERHLSLVDWFLNTRGKVDGFTRAIYSGLPTVAMAQVIAKVINLYPELSGLYHVSTDPINKYELLRLIALIYQKTNISLEPDPQLAIDRSLLSTRFRQATGWQPAPWFELVTLMHTDYLTCPIFQKY